MKAVSLYSKPIRIARLLAALLLTSGSSLAAQGADIYPSKPIRLLIASVPGSAPDVLARIVGQRLGEELGQQIIIDNRAGAAGALGWKLVADAQPDGYTLGIVSAAFATTPAVMKLPYDPRNGFGVVAGIASVPLIMVVNASSNYTSVKTLIDAAKADPGKINYASPGAGGLQHLVTEALSRQSGIRMVHVPYRGGSLAVAAVVSGEASMFFSGLPPALPMVNQGRLRALAVSTLKRSDSVPQVPTMDELGFKGFQADNWHGILSPAGVSATQVKRINDALVRILAQPEVKKLFVTAGGEALWTDPAAFRALISTEIDRWGKVVQAIGFKQQ